MKRKIRWDIWLKRDEPLLFPNGTSFDIEGVIYEDVEFESIHAETWEDGNILWKDASNALDEHMKEKYPGKKYQVYYWTWLD